MTRTLTLWLAALAATLANVTTRQRALIAEREAAIAATRDRQAVGAGTGTSNNAEAGFEAPF